VNFFSAMLLGVLASAHCAAMCGGFQFALQSNPDSLVLRSNRQRQLHLLTLNFGRITAYVVAGVILSGFGTALIKLIDIPSIGQAMRYLAALVLLLLGFQLLVLNQRPFRWLEKYGASVWRYLSSTLGKRSNNRLSDSYFRGLIWAFLPCGLIYSVLLSTLFTDTVVQGAEIMLGFGLGTLPAMLLTGNAYQIFRESIRFRGVQLAGGALYIAGGSLMMFGPSLINMDFMHAYPQLMTSMFCLS